MLHPFHSHCFSRCISLNFGFNFNQYDLILIFIPYFIGIVASDGKVNKVSHMNTFFLGEAVIVMTQKMSYLYYLKQSCDFENCGKKWKSRQGKIETETQKDFLKSIFVFINPHS